ncbi:hypothetical protein [Atlantibacter sp.]|uniref:hypothetical protein n=1 Tax=Atlantibacter sp. TaxID=1903473 RepID=UPI0028AF9D71|nr:hypothetical protein [Atlantibacter sp.]
MTTNNKHLVRAGHEFAAAMTSDTPIITIAKMVTELASALDVQSARSDALAAELARYSMSAGDADQRMAESRAARQTLGFGQDADDVAPVDLVERINALAAALKASEANDADARCHVAELEEKCAALAGENVALKAGVTYFAYSPEYGFDYFKDKQSAIDTAQAEIDAYREDADDGWSEDVQRVSWGIVIQQAQGFDAQGLHTSDSQHTYQTCDYKLVDTIETPATDAWVNEQRAVGATRVETNIRACYEEFPESSRDIVDECIQISANAAAQLRGSKV